MALAVAALIGAGAVATGWDADDASSPTRPPVGDPEPPAAADAIALVGGLGAGDRLGSWTVAAVRAPDDGRLPILIVAEGASVTLWVARKGSKSQPPPSETEKYSIYVSSPFPVDAPGAKLSMAEPMEALATRLRSTEATVPTPAGM